LLNENFRKRDYCYTDFPGCNTSYSRYDRFVDAAFKKRTASHHDGITDSLVYKEFAVLYRVLNSCVYHTLFDKEVETTQGK